MWKLDGMEKPQEKLDAKKSKLVFKARNDKALKKKTISLASVIYRMVFTGEPTYYLYEREGQKKYSEQCTSNSLRSCDDMYCVAKNYVKSVTREKVEQTLQKLIKEDMICQDFCNDIRKRVHIARNVTTTLTDIKNALKND